MHKRSSFETRRSEAGVRHSAFSTPHSALCILHSAFRLAAVAAFAATAACRAYALDAYVSTAGSNDNDGGDWDHALLSISDAYARVAAAGGGTVHVAGGIYRSTQGHFASGGLPFILANDVAIVGSADPDNPTIITGDKFLDNSWEDGSPQWIDGVLQLPPEGAYWRPRRVGQNDETFLVSSAAATNCVFRNLTIHGFGNGGTARGISLDGAENVRIENCRFVGIGSTDAHPSSVCLTLANGSGVVSNCLFAGYNGGLSLNAAEPTAFAVVDSRFWSGVNLGAYQTECLPGARVTGAAAPCFADCSFEWLKAGNNCIRFDGTAASAAFTNCVFRNCALENGNAMAAAILVLGSTKLSFVKCRFDSNSTLATAGAPYVKATCLATDSGSFSLRDCSFIGNTFRLDSGSASAYAIASVAAIVNFGKFEAANCAFVDNSVSVFAETANACTFGGWRPQKAFFANCVFRDNDCLAGGTRKPEFRSIGMGHANTAPMFVNTVVWNEAEDYVPFLVDSGAATGTVGIASCIIKGFDAPAASGYGFKYDLLDENPAFCAKEVAKGILSTPTLSGRSPALARHGAVKVCEATDGKLYFLDTNKNPNVWRLLGAVNSGSLSLAQGEAVGLFVDTPSIPDIFGNPRAAQSPIGPYALCPSPATVVELR